MNTLLWIVQLALALHTLMGAVWKVMNSEQTVPSLRALPSRVWQGLGLLELVAAAALVLPAVGPSLGVLAPVGAALVTAEMLLFSAVHLKSAETKHGLMVYWLVVGVVAAFVVVGRLAVAPL